MNKVYVSFALAGALALSANAVEVNPFGHLGAYYHQGFGGLPTLDKNNKELQASYANVSARAGLDIGLGSSISVGLGGWGAYPFYSTGNPNAIDGDVGDKAFPKNGDVSDAYVRYDGTRLSFALGRFDIGQFYLGIDGKNYTGVDWIYGNVQGGALNVDGGAISLWAYWRNSQLGTGAAYNRMGYELSSFNTYQNHKKQTKIGELASAGLDFNFDALKISPFVSYLTDYNTSVDVPKGGIGTDDILNVGGKIQLELGSTKLKSITILRAIYGMDNLTGKGKSSNGLTLWADEEIRLNDIFKIGVGYIKQDTNSHLLNFGDRTRFYGYRGGLSGANFGDVLNVGKSTWYVFAGIDSQRVALDLLYAGGDYEEISAVGSVKIWKSDDDMYVSLGAGYVGTKKSSTTLYRNEKWQNSALAFAKFAF